MFAVSKRVKVIFFMVVAIAVRHTEAYSQELLVFKDEFHTELFLRIDPDEITAVARDGPQSVAVSFKKNIKTPFNQKMDDPFIDNVSGSGRRAVINFKSNADYAVFNDAKGLRIIATHMKAQDDVLLSYGVGAPMLRKENRFTEDPVLDAIFRESEALIRTKQPYKAAEKLKMMIASTKNNFYKQDALFRLGALYMDLAQSNRNMYVEASLTFDQLINEYPDNNRMPLVRQLNAMAKERQGDNISAANAYYDVYNTSSDAETKRTALEKVGDLFLAEDRWERAVEAYEHYLDEFKTGNERILHTLGELHLSKRQYDKAYELFKNVPPEIIAETLGPSNLFSLAKIFEERGDFNKALPLYTRLISDNVTETPESLYRVAQMRKTNDDMEGYSRLLKDLSRIFIETEHGLTALVEYAELHYPEKSTDEWKSELEPVYQAEDAYNLVPRAQLVLIKSLYREDDPVRLIPTIDNYVIAYPESPELPYLAHIKEDMVYTTAINAHEQKQYAKALTYYHQLLDEFPESPRCPDVVQFIDDIHFARAKQLFDDRWFRECRAATEVRILTPPDAQPRWRKLWEDAVYQYILTNTGVLPEKSIRFKCREYLTFVPDGIYVNQIKQILLDSFSLPFKQAYEDEDDPDVIVLYEENQGWLDLWFDQEFSNRSKVMTTTSLMRLNVRDKAAELFRSITPMLSKEYALLGFGLCQDNILYDINNFAPDDFTALVDDTDQCNDPDYSLSMIKRYARDPKTALKAQYKLLKNIPDDRKRERLLNDAYVTLSENEASRFNGYEEVYLDTGVLSFKKNDYQGAIAPLKNYVDTTGDSKSEKKAEALYYLGKSLIALNEQDRAFEYYKQLTDSIPESIFAGMAKGEMEDSAWRKNLNNR
ncbi:MAG: tetratricopeptide repeat protein [Deferribacteraceae bacterium]|jgi:TolA-binding protein|nr:tetratricopeptide repeat protein [Deferribacteraceae bacterium]